MNKRYIIYDEEGNIIGTCNIPESVFPQRFNEDSLVIQHDDADCNSHYIIDGVVHKYTQNEIDTRGNVPFGHKWNVSSKSITQVLSNEEIAITLAQQARNKRGYLLTQTDWTQTVDQVESRRLAFQEYRQSLRDITIQSGFPQDIVWPIKPLI